MATSLHEGPTNQLDLLIRAGKDRGTFLLCIGAAGEGCTEGGVTPLWRSVPGVQCPPQSLGRPGERGVVNEVMEATNQEVITLESNLPRIWRCRFRVGSAGSGGSCRAERWQRVVGSRAAVKLGTRGRTSCALHPSCRGTRK